MAGAEFGRMSPFPGPCFSVQSPPRLSVSIVLHHSAPALLYSTLASLDAAAERAVSEGVVEAVEVVLVDNASAPDYLESLQHQCSQMTFAAVALRWLPQPDNSGFGAGHNRALAGLQSDLHLVLNPDVELDAQALCEGTRVLVQRPEVGLVCPAVSTPDGAPDYLCKRYPSLVVLLLRGFAPRFVKRLFRGMLDHYEARDIIDAGVPANVEIASGCFMLLRTSGLAAVEGFDEGYFLYFEDFDLSLRLREDGVGTLLYWPDMRIIHHGGDAARKGFHHVRYFLRSARRFFAQHGWRLW